MQTRRSQQPESPERASAQSVSQVSVCRGTCITLCRRRALFAACAILFVAPCLCGVALAAQAPTTPQPGTTQPAAHPTAHTRRKPSAAKHVIQPVQPPAPPAPLALAAPQIPNWPANNKPAEATVIWDSHGLLIQASNSSLGQILQEISLKIGAKVEGLGADQRIFGTYGPGSARDVLSQLLDGSGYNVLLVGDRGEGTPRRVVLSGRATGPAQPPGNTNPGANNQNDTENDQEAQQEPEPQQQPTYNPGPAVPVRSPQEIFQQRQQQLQQMQQQQQQQNNPPNPQN